MFQSEKKNGLFHFFYHNDIGKGNGQFYLYAIQVIICNTSKISIWFILFLPVVNWMYILMNKPKQNWLSKWEGFKIPIQSERISERKWMGSMANSYAWF